MSNFGRQGRTRTEKSDNLQEHHTWYYYTGAISRVYTVTVVVMGRLLTMLTGVSNTS